MRWNKFYFIGIWILISLPFKFFVVPANASDLHKDATPITLSNNQNMLNTLPFNNQQSFKDADRGFIAPLPNAADKRIVLNLEFPDTNQKYTLELDHGTLNHMEGVQAENANATITLNRETLNQILLKQKSLKEEIDAGNVKIQGNKDSLMQLLSMLDDFNLWFNIVTPQSP